MKIKAHVLGVEDAGNRLRVTAQGQAGNAPSWAEWLSITIHLPLTEKTKKAYYVGRHITIEVTTDKVSP